MCLKNWLSGRASWVRRGLASSTERAMINRGRSGPAGPLSSLHFATQPRAIRVSTSASTNPMKLDGMRLRISACRKARGLYGWFAGEPRCESMRKSCRCTPPSRYGRRVSRRWWSARMTSCQKATCFRGRPGAKRTPPLPAAPYGGAPRQMVGLSRVVRTQDVGPHWGSGPGGGVVRPSGFFRRA